MLFIISSFTATAPYAPYATKGATIAIIATATVTSFATTPFLS